MNEEEFNTSPCKDDAEVVSRLYREIPPVVQDLARAWRAKDSFDQAGPVPMPSTEEAVAILHQTRRILFPGYFTDATPNPETVEYILGQETAELFERLARQLVLSIQHECFRAKKACVRCHETGHAIAMEFIRTLPRLEAVLATDVRAAYEGDPAAKGPDEIVFSYPGLFAITVYRIAHELFRLRVPLLPRIMTEYAHGRTGIDIHPGAAIGESFFIDHGTGVVIGETTVIGRGVRLYQGVTLGALSLPKDAGNLFRNQKRHPTIEDDVIVYANSTILGGETIIGARSVIGGNVWLTESVPPDTRVLLKRPELVYKDRGSRKRHDKKGA